MTDELTEEIKNSETADEANLEAQPVPDATGEAAGESDEAGADAIGKKRVRTFEVVTELIHPVTGLPIITEDEVVRALEDHKMVEKWAYIIHDKDPVEPGNSDAGIKPEHIHIVAKMTNGVPVSSIAKWFRVPVNFIRFPASGDKDFFMSKCEYLTHEHPKQVDAGKYHYPDDEVKSNFDFRGELSAWQEKRDSRGSSGKGSSKKGEVRSKVLYEGMTIREVKERYPDIYRDDFAALDKLRKKFIAEQMQVPSFRLNFYLDGKGGVGKNTAARALARSLFPGITDPEELYYEVGGENVAFDGYDGQPVIIWNDRRSADFIRTFGRGETFDIFDDHPTGSKHNIKYGDVKLVNAVNIVNGVEPYDKFLDGLAGEYKTRFGKQKAEDKGQAYRRFPIIFCLRENDFDVLLSKGIAEDTYEYDQYLGWFNIKGNFGRVRKTLDAALAVQYENAMVAPALEAVRIVTDRENAKISDPALVPAEFADFGRMMTPEEVAARDARNAAWVNALQDKYSRQYREYQKPYLNTKDFSHPMGDMLCFSDFITEKMGESLDPPGWFAPGGSLVPDAPVVVQDADYVEITDGTDYKPRNFEDMIKDEYLYLDIDGSGTKVAMTIDAVDALRKRMHDGFSVRRHPEYGLIALRAGETVDDAVRRQVHLESSVFEPGEYFNPRIDRNGKKAADARYGFFHKTSDRVGREVIDVIRFGVPNITDEFFEAVKAEG